MIFQGALPERLAARLDPAERYGLRLTLVAVAVVLVAVPFSSLLFAVVASGPVNRFDGRVADALNGWVHAHPGSVGALQAVSLLGRPGFLAVVVAVAALVVVRRGHRRPAVFLIVTSLGGGIVDSLVKLAVDRPRPVVDHPVATAFGKSFPSGHAMSSTVVYGALLVVFLAAVPPRGRRALVGSTVALVLAVGSSRLLLGVHFVSDVVGGHLLGAAWLLGSVAAFETWRSDTGRRRTRPLAEGIEPEADASRPGEGRPDESSTAGRPARGRDVEPPPSSA